MSGPRSLGASAGSGVVIGVAVGVGAIVGVGVGVSVGETVGVVVAVGEVVGVAIVVGDGVGLAVGVLVLVDVATGAIVGDGVTVFVEAVVAVGEEVGVAVGVFVGEASAVTTRTTTTGVQLGSGEGVHVGTGVHVGATVGTGAGAGVGVHAATVAIARIVATATSAAHLATGFALSLVTVCWFALLSRVCVFESLALGLHLFTSDSAGWRVLHHGDFTLWPLRVAKVGQFLQGIPVAVVLVVEFVEVRHADVEDSFERYPPILVVGSFGAKLDERLESDLCC